MNWNAVLAPSAGPFAVLRRELERRSECEAEPCGLGMSIHEFDNRWVVSVDAPGLKETDLNVTFDDGVLVIEGERALAVPDGAREIFNDRTAGKFRRSVRVRESVDLSSIEAELANGVLTLTLKKSEEAGSRKIPIRSASSQVSQ